MHRNLSVDLTYGCGKYDYTNGTLICVAPGQIGGKEDDGGRINLDGWALLFHPDILHGTLLENMIYSPLSCVRLKMSWKINMITSRTA